MELLNVRKLGELKKKYPLVKTVREEMRGNLIAMLTAGKTLFPGLK